MNRAATSNKTDRWKYEIDPENLSRAAKPLFEVIVTTLLASVVAMITLTFYYWRMI